MTDQLLLQFEPDELMLGPARHFLAEALARLECADPDGLVVLLADELLSNAMQAGAAAVSLRVSCVAHGRLRIEVRDDGPGWPQLRHVGPDSTTGRGLGIVDAVSDGWGVVPESDGSKTVWFEYEHTSLRVPTQSSSGDAVEPVGLVRAG